MILKKAVTGLMGMLLPLVRAVGSWQMTVGRRKGRTLQGVIALLILVLAVPEGLSAQGVKVTGTVVTAQGQTIAGAAIYARQSNTIAMSSATGSFTIVINTIPDTIQVTHVNYRMKQYVLERGAKGGIVVTMDEAVNELDETVVIGYGATSKRYNTGSVAKLTAKELEKQPVSDLLTALAGRMTGVSVTQTSGVPGSSVGLQIRGRNSIVQGSEPLYIIDGVPMAAQNQVVSKIGSVLDGGAGTGLSAFAAMSPSEIESIEILKDADATAIYGSRGANGVVLITTKKGRPGKTRLNIDVYRSMSTTTREIKMMGTKEYLQMRREAFANDGATATVNNAPDLLLWDTTRYTDFQQLVYSGKAPALNVSGSLSGGDLQTQFVLSGSYRDERTMFGSGMGMQRATAAMNIQHKRKDGKLEVKGSVNFGSAKHDMTVRDLGYVVNISPNLPSLYDSDGKLKWQEAGVNYENPLAYLHNSYAAYSEQLNGRVNIGYLPAKGFRLSTSVGYNVLRTDETSKNPLAGQNPLNNPLAALELATGQARSWIAEPQAEYETKLYKGVLKLLAGATMQDNTTKGNYIRATGYTSDNLINSLAAAPTIASRRNNLTQYRYEAVFGKLHYNWLNKYIVNISGRYDGSSRFGPGKQFSAFGAVGAAWMLSNEGFIKQAIPVLSYGKLRMSYGSSGNDQISDYGYMDAWGSTNAYQGTSALYPLNLFNPDYGWEVNRKLETALEMGFYKDRLLLNIAWYRNRSGNQLVGYRLPSQTGFNTVIQNFDALVENTGVEVELATRNIETKNFLWSTSFNISVPCNRLLHFPNLSSSSYVSTYVEGESLDVIYQYGFNGVDPATGLFVFDDTNKDGVLNSKDYVVSGKRDAVFFGGLQNSISWKGFEVDVFAEFRKQTGRNYLYSLYSAGNIPGMMFNLPVYARDRWQKPGDNAAMQRLTAVTTSGAYAATSNFLSSNGVYSDASFIRIKNVSLRYHLPEKWLKRAGVASATIYIQGQNVATITSYKGADPEVQNLWMQSPLRTWAMGARISL